MGLILYSSHQILSLACQKAYTQFYKEADQIEHVQRQKLNQILEQPHLNYEEFVAQYPITRYADWKAQIEQSREQAINSLNSQKVIRFQPTSGSSEALKFIPYTQGFLDELDQAIGLWLRSLYQHYPELKNTTHYWSVSWLPESQRKLTHNQNLNDDSALLSFSKRMLTKVTQSVPTEIALAESAEDAMFATATYLVADEHLGLISVWSPTFALQLLEIIQMHQDEIVATLQAGQWQRQSLQFLEAPKNKLQSCKLRHLNLEDAQAWKMLWNKLTLISSWDTASAEHWAAILKQKISGIAFEGKGLWATEGVVTIPLDGHYPLMYQSHFYEFLDLDDQQVYPAWQLKMGQHVSPILTTGSGLTRYIIDDELLVTDFYQNVPCFRFMGRKMTVDLVGEKINHFIALIVIEHFKQHDYLPMSLLGIEQSLHKKPHYVLLSEGNSEAIADSSVLDQLLKKNFHYELARNLGQLDEPSVKHVDDAWDYYKKLAMHNGMIEGNIKPEPLKKIKTMVD